MTVNLQKSASQSFSLTHETFRPELQYQNTSIANTDSFTYLGTPRQKVLDFRKDLAIPDDIQPLLKPGNPLQVINVDVKLDLVETIHRKREVAPSILRSLALETIAVRYSATDWLHIFTGAIQSIVSFKLPLTPEISHCQEHLRTLILITLKGKRIVLQWVPVYCSLWDKEQANFLAKKCANLLQHRNAATSYWKIKLFLNNLCISNSLRDLQIRAALKSWRRFSPSSIPDKPRRDAVAALRLTTGHDCLAAHLHLLGISTEPFCPLCDSGEVMERNHLLRCGALQGLTEMSTYWEARALLGQ
ncbi:hypothetical protein AVEN_216987-1 [Araneus ventricosus]|uniref:RNase H type-1 domain-containing protein n=1 Tax=Araneus ventricosus TaxID=182803 RepID=A0A4Y2WH10_ARAVE|nr:hypothetical protein AVEN_99909-1 [Araneus ventricosus]GBO36276.1 hypothetical protein AVEN_216987-1 [Araneus ventricosus]